MMVRYLIILCIWLFPGKNYSQTLLDNLQNGDTLYVNFCISHSEFGSIHDGILIYKDKNSFFGKHVLYNYGVSLLPNKLIKVHPNVEPVALVKDSVTSFYSKIKTNYIVLKKDWKLEEQQIQYLKDYFSELEKFESKGFSNTPDFYTVISGEKSFVAFDRAGSWDKFLEVKKIMKL